MNNEIFGVENINLISDSQYYYVFRALNRDDQSEINDGITAIDGKIQKVITNKQRYPENSKYSTATQISLKEVWDHTRSFNFYRGTSCISLSSNANISIDYGSKYGHKYLMVRIPKGRKSNIINVGQYMLTELNSILDGIINNLPRDSDVFSLINEIENKNANNEILDLISARFNDFHSSSGRYTSKSSINTRISLIERFKTRQIFSQEQQLEFSKIMGKLSVLDISGLLPRGALDNINISSLTRTIGSEFSNREFIHYGEMTSDEFVPISRINLELFALIQAGRDHGIDEKQISQIQERLIEFTNQGYELVSRDGKLYYSNANNSIDLNLNDDSILINEDSLLDGANILIDEMFEKTNGTISFVKAKNAMQFIYNLSIAERKTIELANVLRTIIGDSKLLPVIDEIAQESIAINNRIITRINGRGIQISESVNIDMNRGGRKQFSDKEQLKIYEHVSGLTEEELDSIIAHNATELEQSICMDSLRHRKIDSNMTKQERLNRYYAEAIIDFLDMSKIYKNTIRDKNLNEEERKAILNQLERADCKRLFDAFLKAGINQSDISGYILNILANNGYQGYTFEELSRLPNLDEIISVNVQNTNLKGHIYPSVMEELRGIRDNDNRTSDSPFDLRDYQGKIVENIDKIFSDGKRFAGVVLPTGAGKSFVAMKEMLNNKNGNIIYIAPQQEILSQLQRHILKYIAKVEVLTTQEISQLKEEQKVTDPSKLRLPEGKILPKQANEYVKKIFPHLRLLCYQGLSSFNDADLTDEQIESIITEERELREILKNADANLIIFDELHRSGARTWKSVVEQLINSNKKANILGLTATPIRDVDHVDMMKEIANMTNTYTPDELATGHHLAYEMYLIEAIQRGLVVEPKIVSFDFMLRDTDEYQEIVEMILSEKDEAKKKQLLEIKNQIDDLISENSDITEHIKNNISKKENEEIGKIIESTIKKKDGRYIIFLPQHSHNDGLTENEYFEEQTKKIREVLSKIDSDAEIYRLSSEDSKTENHRSITDFENSNSSHLKIMLAINKLNEGVHVERISGEIMYRKINDGSTILYLQQLGRVIFSLDPDNPLDEENIPIVYDIYNNYLVQNLNRTINQTTPKSDLQKFEEIIEWIEKHGYTPDINSENTKEARRAITLKKIQTKYKKYIDGINNPRLNKADIYQIEQIMILADSIDLFNVDFGTRIIPPGEKDIVDVQLFKVTATQRKFLELYKKANKTVGNNIRHKNRPTARLNDIMNILETLNSNDIFIDNKLVQYGDTLKDVIDRCPEETRQILLEELYEFDQEYPIGQEYNYAKAAFRDRTLWRYFKDKDVRNLYACGIFEDIDTDYFNEHLAHLNRSDRIMSHVLFYDFIVYGPTNLRGLNIKTGTYFDENGYNIKDPNKKNNDDKDKDKEKLEKNLKLIEFVYTHLRLGYTLANESLDEIESLPLKKFVQVFGPRKNTFKSEIPNTTLRMDIILQQTRYLLTELGVKIDYKQIIEYKKRGIIPLKLNKDGIDEDTGLPVIVFGKRVKDFRQNEGPKDALQNLVDILRLTRDEYKVSIINTGIADIPNINLADFISKYKTSGSSRHNKGIPKNFNLRKEIMQVREYLKKMDLSLKQIIEFKKLGILPLNLDENGIDMDTNLPRRDFEIYSHPCGNVDKHGFNSDGYYCKKMPDGTYVNTGLRYTPTGFDKDGKHIITKTSVDIRGFDIDGKIYRNNRYYSFCENGFKQDGTHKDTGELYYKGYNAFGLDINGRDVYGNKPFDVRFTIDLINNGIKKGNLAEIIKKWGIGNSFYQIQKKIYIASQMHPPIKDDLCSVILNYQTRIKKREEKLAMLEDQQSDDYELRDRLKEQNQALRYFIKLLDPMANFEK